MGRPDRPLLPHYLARVSPSERRITQMRRFFCDLPPENQKQNRTLETDWPIPMGETIEKQPEAGRPFAPSVERSLGRYRAQDSVPPKGQTNEETDEDVS